MLWPPLWPAGALAAATGGRLTASFSAAGISIDTRTLRPDDLFVALAGEHRDGHEFVADALARAAAGALVSRIPAGLSDAAPLLIVPDTLAGLAALGAHARARATARVAAITGSVGKTTTKEMLRRILSDVGPTHAARASYNNQWGVPLTLAELPPDAAFAVLEIGTNHAGEILPLAALARPHVAVITAIASAHIGYFGSLEAIAEEKASLLSALEPGGIAILPANSPFLPRLAAHVPEGCRILTFGEGPDADARLLSAAPDATGTNVAAILFGEAIQLRLAATGRHMAEDALAALAAAVALGLAPREAAASLEGFAALAGRGARTHLQLPGGEAILLDESYNASPAAVAAALSVLALGADGCGGRRLAVLGDMLELGEEAAAAHENLAASLPQSADLLFACGPMMRRLFERTPVHLRGAYAENSESLAPVVAAAIAPGDVVLVKGSLGSRMRHVVAALEKIQRPESG
ncbi:MAG TPA: UDP-N-acetylmuramoyl-tripeptide--D-alanyl-D-alanine ligase, partial [Acetobacteraceae bacterium]|nr:UDP-N-acetylmuramoyl-tripeptide--D-alanyl-D-alanine ligase [Acetobacteraceae bacterium]